MPRSRRFDQCTETCTVDCGHCKGRPVEALRAEVDTLRQQVDEARAELEHWRSGRRRKGMPVIESVPDGLHYAAELVRSQGTEGGEDHDRLLSDAAMRMKALHDAAAALLADRDRLLVVYRAAEAWRDHLSERPSSGWWGDLAVAVDAYRSAAPAEPAPG